MISDFVQSNPLLTILIVAALALLFLIVVIIVVIVIRRRRVADEEELPPVPDVPYAPQPYDVPQADVSTSGDFGSPTAMGGSADWGSQTYDPVSDYGGGAVPPTQAAGGSAGAAAITTAPGSSAAQVPPPPAYVPPLAQSSVGAAGGTQILDRGPRMPVVGLLIDPRQPNRRFDVSKPAVTIGRGGTNDVVIEDGTISRQHATIKWEDGVFRVYDLASSNGTFVGEQRVRAPVALQDGASVRFGGVELTFRIITLAK
jgi:hypothetical protein